MQPLKKVNSFPPFSFSYCLSRNTLFINLLLLPWIFKIKQISSSNLLLVDFDFFFFAVWFEFIVLCICISWGAFSHFYYHETTFMNSFIFPYIHSFLFGVSWCNHVKNYRVLSLFQFPRKLSTRLILPP